MSKPDENSTQVFGISVRLYPDNRMDAASAAAYVGLHEKTLANHRCRGTGPKFTKRGRVFYFKADLDEWLEAGRAQSTAQARLKSRQRDTDR